MSLKILAQAWNRFFFDPIAPTSLAIYRILTGLVFLWNAGILFEDVEEFFGDGVLTEQTALLLNGGQGMNLFRILPDGNAWIFSFFFIHVLSAIFVTLGFATRVNLILLFLTFTSLCHRNPLIVNSGDSFLRICVFFLIFSPAGAALSIDRLIRLARGKEQGPPALITPWVLRLIQLQTAWLYFTAYLWKIRGELWMNGTAVYYTTRLEEFWRFPLPYIFEHLWTIKLWTWGTLIIEFAMGTLIWIKELRYWVLLAGILLHLGIDYTMNIPLFGVIMVSAYITFVEPQHIHQAFANFRNALSRFLKLSPPLPVFYDGKCSFCRQSIAVVRALDIFHRLRFIDMHSPEASLEFPDLDLERGAQEMMVRTHSGQWFGGFLAFRKLAKYLPLAWPILPFLHLPLATRIGTRAYQKVAANRYCLINS
ncbi:MAG: HTTM domain-containing protein [Verrucomicrobiota bacterium]|nr:HTTM domain-containing protein [Verrucomicrobiota bacterium]